MVKEPPAIPPEGVFEFRECVKLLKATGRKAKNLRELRDLMEIISPDSIYHHTYEYFFKLHVLEYTNDFARWVGETLEIRALAEVLSNIDPYRGLSIEELRMEFITHIDNHLARFPAVRQAREGGEFHFNETVTFVFRAGLRAKNLAEFLMALRFVDVSSIYYHFHEARTRVGVNDFSAWLAGTLGKAELAGELRKIDLLMHTVPEIRAYLIKIVEEELKKEIEVQT